MKIAATPLELDAQAPSPRTEHSAVWTGTEMIIWGGRASNGVVNTGGRYNPQTDSWTPTSTVNAPTPRMGHISVWTGVAMMVWGGYDYYTGVYYADGACYNPSTDTWTPTPASGTPSPRANHVGIWTGTQALLWGGASNSVAVGEVYLASGAGVNPETGPWASTATNSAPYPRQGHTGVWTGSKMIVWGGVTFDGLHNPDKDDSGGVYDPSTGVWSATSTNNAPTNRTEHTAVWTGSKMIIWGGLGNGALDYFNNGSRYDPATDSWQPTSTNGAPSIRQLHSAVWTGSEMIVWGGRAAANFRGNGGRYNPVTDSWSSVSTTGAPAARANHTAIWTGREMIVWGGETSAGVFCNSIGRYQAAQNVWDFPPTCNVAGPANGSSVAAAYGVQVSATATDSDGSVSQVDFYSDGAFIGSSTTPSAGTFAASWSNPSGGTHAFTAVATDNLGVKTTSAPVNVTVILGTPPNVSLDSPSPSSMVVANGAADLLASASDTDGSVNQVTFFVNGSQVGTASTPPFKYPWTNNGLGFFTLTAIALDNAGLTRTSAPVVVESVFKPKLTVQNLQTQYSIALTGGQTGRTYRLEVSSNLVTWTPFTTNVASNGTLQIFEEAPSNSVRRFYRAIP